MRIPLRLGKSWHLIFMWIGLWYLGALRLSGQSAAPPQPSAVADGRVADTEERAGPFSIAGENYTVVLRKRRLETPGDPALAQTLSGMEIRDAAGNVSYQKPFPPVIERGRFQRALSATPELASGKTGAGLVIHYREETANSPASAPQIREYWQLFGLVGGKFALMGKPAPIGEGATGGPFMGVMMRAANGTVSVVSQPDTIEVRAWTGYFYIFVPLRVDWNHGRLAQGQRCMEMIGGGLKEVGCDMRVEAVRKPPADEFTFVRIFGEANENMGEAEHGVIQKDSKVEILGSRAITTWNEHGELIQPVFSDLWLHVRIDDRTGWIHDDDDFAAAGLPAGSPAP
jgi:hypothetical protein